VCKIQKDKNLVAKDLFTVLAVEKINFGY